MSALLDRKRAIEADGLRQQFQAQVRALAAELFEQTVSFGEAVAALMVDHGLPWLHDHPEADALAIEERISDRLADAAFEHEFAQAGLPQVWAQQRWWTRRAKVRRRVADGSRSPRGVRVSAGREMQHAG